MSTKRRIVHVDMDAFFAAVEEKRRPELRGKPVVIGGGGDPAKRGVVSTANYKARRYGIHSAMPLRSAYKLCSHAVFLPVDYEAYAAMSLEFKAVLLTISPVMQDGGIDEAFLDVSHLDDSDEEIARKIKVGIRQKTGLTCSIGIAPNKLLAKTASDMRKPDGLTILNVEDIESRLGPLPIRKLYGVGPKTESYLRSIGIETIGQLAGLPLETLVGHFGRAYGRYLYEAARGMDDSPLVTSWEPKSISREMTFQEDIGNWQTIARTLAGLIKEVVSEMREQGYKARTFTVKIRFSDFRTLTRATTLLLHTNLEEEVRKAAFMCLKRIELNKKVRLIGMRAGNFQKSETDV
jgi:DNA polymerase-4